MTKQARDANPKIAQPQFYGTSCRPRKGIPMKKETTKKSKLWIWIVVAAVLLLAAGGTALALLGGGNQGAEPTVATDPVPTGPRADLYWNLDREFYTANSQTGLSTREADADGKFRMKFAYNGEIVELVIIDKKLVNIIDTQDIVGLTFDENGVVIAQTNVRELATEVGKKVYVKKATDDMIQANSSMAMNGMELNLKLGQYSEIYDLREGSETYGKKIAPSDLGVMDCMTVYANADGDNTHFFILQAAQRSKIYWRANLWTSASNNAAGFKVDENGYTILPFYADGEYVEVKTNDAALVEYYAGLGRHNGFTGLIFDENGYAIDVLNAAVGIAGQRLFYALDITEINGNYIKAKNNISTSGTMNWEGELPEDLTIYAMGSWAYSEGIMGKKMSVSDLKVNDRITVFSDMDGNPIEAAVTNRIYNLKPMYNNNQKYDASTRSTTRVADEEGYWTYTFIDEKGIHKYKTKDQKLANFIDSYPEKTFGIVTKGDKLVKAYEYENLFGQVRFSTALYIDSINSSIISCTDQRKANAYTGILSEDVKVLDISGDSKQWGQKIKLQLGDCMISFKNLNKEICMIYVTKRSMGGKLYVNVAPNSSRALVEVKNEETGEVTERYWEYLVTDMNGKETTLKLPSGKYDETTKSYANKYLQSRIDSATQGVIALEVSGGKIKDAHAPGNMASGNTVGTVIITKAGTEEFEYKTSASATASVYPGWTGKEGLKMLNLSGEYKDHKGEKLSGKMKVGDVYFMVRNRPNETVALFLTNRGVHKDLYFVKDYAKDEGTGIYTFNVMYQGKAKTLTAGTEAVASALISKANGAVLKLDGTMVTAVYAANYSIDAYSTVISNWDITKISGKKLTATLSLPVAGTEVGSTKELDITGAKIYDLSPNAGDNYGKTTSLKKGDRIRVYIDREGAISYVHVLVRNASKTAKCPHCNKTVTWNALTAASGIGNGVGTAHYYIYEDMEVGGRFMNIASADGGLDVILDLNGKTVTHVGNTDRMIMVAYKNNLTILDTSAEKTGVLQSYGWPGNGNIMQLSYGSKFTLLSGTLKHINEEGRVSVNQGGVIFSYSDGDYDRNVINIKGGQIIGGVVTHNTAGKTATGVIHAYKTDITMTDGAIVGGTADRGGNLNLASTTTFTMKGGELVGGTARDLGGNIFANTGTKVTIEGGKISGGNANNGGGNIYAYGAEVLVMNSSVTEGTGNSNGQNIYLSTSATLYMNNATVSGGVYAANECAVMVAGDTKVTSELSGVRLAKGATMLVDALAETASIAVYADGEFAKASAGTAVDVESYMNKQIITADADCTLSVVTDANGTKWLSAKVPSEAEIGKIIADKAVQMTTDGVFTVAEGQEPAVVEATCPVCKETAQWAPLTATLNKLDETEYTHFYLPSDIERSDNGRYQIGGNKKICIHLNGYTYDQKATSAVEGAIKVNNGATLNIMGNGKVIGAGGYYAASAWVMGGAIDVRGTVNIYGGTYQSSHNRATIATFSGSANISLNMYAGEILPSTSATENPSGFWGSVVMNHKNHTFNMYGGTITGADNAASGNLKINAGTFNMYGGEISGRVVTAAAAVVNINNGAKIGAANGGLVINGATVKLAKDLAEGTQVYISDPANAGAFLTAANDKAKEYANVYILAAESGKTIEVSEDNKMFIPGQTIITIEELDELLDTPVPEGKEYHETICPLCRTEVQWIPLSAPTAVKTLLTAGHYYLKEDITATVKANFETSGTDAVICVHLNGKTYSQALTIGQEGAFKVAGGTTLNLMGTGTVIGTGSKNDYGYTGGAIDARGNVNIYGGTYKSAFADRPALGTWNTAANIAMYGGQVVKNDLATDATGVGSVGVYMRDGKFALYGGTISGGLAQKGGNILVKGGALTVAGGTIDGDVYAEKGTITIKNGANIAATNGGLTVAGTATVNLADDLAAGTKVYLTDGAGEGAALTAANAKAAEYAQTYIFAADETKVVKADADNKLFIAAAE